MRIITYTAVAGHEGITYTAVAGRSSQVSRSLLTTTLCPPTHTNPFLPTPAPAPPSGWLQCICPHPPLPHPLVGCSVSAPTHPCPTLWLVAVYLHDGVNGGIHVVRLVVLQGVDHVHRVAAARHVEDLGGPGRRGYSRGGGESGCT